MVKKVKENKELDKAEPKQGTDYNFVYGEKLKIPLEKQEKLVTKYWKLIDRGLFDRKDRETEWQLNSDVSANTRPKKDKPWPGASAVALGFCNENCDVVSDGIMTRANSGQRFWNLIGQDSYSMEHEEEVENWFNYITDTEEEFKFQDEEIRAMVGDDCVVSVINMERSERTVKKWQNLGIITNVINSVVNVIGNYKLMEKKEVTVRHSPKVLKIEDYVPLGKGNDIQKLPGFAYFFLPTLDQLKEKNSIYPEISYYDNLELLEKKEVQQEKQDENKVAEKDAKVQVDNTTPELKVAVVSAKEDINDDGILEEIVLVFEYNAKVFLRCQYNQFFDGQRPFTYGCANPDRDKFHGISFKSIGRPLQLEIESMVDQTNDNWDLVVKKAFVRVAGAKITIGNVEGDDNVVYPGSIFDVQDKNDLSVLNVGSVDYTSLPLINKMENLLQRRFGLSVAGGSDMGDPRASGKKVGMLMAQGSQKIDGVFKRYNNMKASYARMLISRYAQFGDKLTYRVWDKTIDNKKTGKKGDFVIKEIDREVLQNCNFKIFLTGMQFSTSREQEKQEELWSYETLLKSPLLSLPPMKLAEFSETQLESIMAVTKDLLEKYGKYNKERLLPDIDDLKVSIRQQLSIQIEKQLKAEMAQALQNPQKARPDEIAKVTDMANNVDMNGGQGGQ